MAAVSWNNPVNGDWNVAADWSTSAIPTSSDDVMFFTAEPYIVTVGAGISIGFGTLRSTIFPTANSLTFDAPDAALRENTGMLTVAGTLTVNSGLVSLNEANSIGSVAVTGGVLEVGNSGALGAGTVSLSGGELLATANVSLANSVSFSGTSTIAAANGTTLKETGTVNTGFNSTLNFGALGQDGVVIWAADNETLGLPITVNVVAGTLKTASSSLAGIIEAGIPLGRAQPTTVDAGATLDIDGLGLLVANLLGGGAVTDSGAAATLTLDAANFSGAISGPLSLEADGAVTLSGNNTYTGATTIESGGTLQLGDGGAAGSINGAISDGGELAIDHDNALTFTNAIGGDGGLEQLGTGVTTITTANSYAGGTTISAGMLAIGAADALGTGAIKLSGGELLTTANETITDALNFSGTSTIAAAHGTTLNENASKDSFAANTNLNIGAPGEDGTILWHTNELGGGLPSAIDIRAGTLKSGDGQLSLLLDAVQTTIDAGATVDVAGSDNTVIPDLFGGGSIINSGAAATLTLGASNFSGTISGPLSLVFEGDTALSGLEDYSGSTTLAQINGPFTVANAGTYDIVGNQNISGTPATSFLNNGLFEKTGGGGVSDVTTNFINSGALNVLSGSIEFSDGFTNNGVIHGLVTQSGAVTTVSAPVSSDFNGDSKSDILLQNTGGQASIWDMSGNTLVGGGAVSPNPGPSWTAVGTGDFNGDGRAEILWQNSDGQASIWDMNGTSMIGGGAVSPNPGPSWKAIGTGDFNGDGFSDILFQNTSTGQVSIWEMNGNELIGGGPVSPNPGPWKAVGTGDFNGDGHSDILFQNASTGQVSIWEMNGDTLIGGGPVSPNPGLAWKAIGTGDFNDDGLSDILFQNTSTGQVSIWEMNGNTLTGGGPVSPNPGLSWHAIGTGDFNGDGHSDILFQNTSGQASVWEMNGNTLMGGGAVSPNPGASWRAVA
jgi:autotransporter-associated beta strand protein